jgi:hypothetical protein
VSSTTGLNIVSPSSSNELGKIHFATMAAIAGPRGNSGCEFNAETVESTVCICLFGRSLAACVANQRSGGRITRTIRKVAEIETTDRRPPGSASPQSLQESFRFYSRAEEASTVQAEATRAICDRNAISKVADPGGDENWRRG